jgi:hypothetical protein
VLSGDAIGRRQIGRGARHKDFFGPVAIISSLVPEGEAVLLIDGEPDLHVLACNKGLRILSGAGTRRA